jgi:hypothetical protein
MPTASRRRATPKTDARDRVAGEIKGSLEQAAFNDNQVQDPSVQAAACEFLIGLAQAAAAT